MKFSFRISSEKGDTILVSLSSLYDYIKDIVPPSFNQIEIIEIIIARVEGDRPIGISTFKVLSDKLIEIAEDNPNIVFFYSCDTTPNIPKQRKTRKESSQYYRNKLFKTLFQRYVNKTNDEWIDKEIILQDKTEEDYIYHILIRKQHREIAQTLLKEIQTTFNMTNSMK